MLVHIFKIVSALGLLGILFILITNREVVFTSTRKNTVGTPLQREVNITPPVLPQKNELQTTASEAPQSSSSPPPETTQPQEPIPIVKAPPANVATIPKKSQYITMREGQSDTDESYRPIISPCKVPLGYKIGRFDSNFGISQTKFIEEITAASSLWGDQLGKTLFTYNINGPLTINLIYDERQARTDDANNLGLEIENAKITAETLKNTYEQEKLIYTGDGEQLTKDSDAFKARYEIYTDKVTMYNNQGGAPRAEYDQMTKELEELKRISKSLSERRDALLVYMEIINTKVSRYNELVTYINSLIEKSNTLGAKSFTEGRFVPRTNTIDIYQYNDLIKLRRVVAHELGHVLGIKHTKSTYSIMYSTNSATTTTLDQDDIDALKAVCPH